MEAYHQPYVRTGYDQLIAQRTSSIFAYCAKDDGKVIFLDKRGLIVEYQDGTKEGVELGLRFGNAEGSTYPHPIVAFVKLGQVFKKGHPIAYNSNFFEPDFMNPDNIIWRSTMTVKTALYESSQTLEDSSSISRALSKKLTLKTTKVRSLTVEFGQGVKEMLPVGSKLHPTDTLCIVEDKITNDLGLFDEATLATLKRLANKAPKSKVFGVIDRIEVFYNGEVDDMSESLKALALASDKEMIARCKSTNRPVLTGKVSTDYRVAGNPLQPGTAEIKIYITVATEHSNGDKLVFGSQMKSVTGEVMDYEMKTEAGETIDAVFGRKSIAARVVEGVDIIGTTTTVLKVLAKRVCEAYRGNK